MVPANEVHVQENYILCCLYSKDTACSLNPQYLSWQILFSGILQDITAVYVSQNFALCVTYCFWSYIKFHLYIVEMYLNKHNKKSLVH